MEIVDIDFVRGNILISIFSNAVDYMILSSGTL